MELTKSIFNMVVANFILHGHTQLLIECGILNPRDFSIDTSKTEELVKMLQGVLEHGT